MRGLIMKKFASERGIVAGFQRDSDLHDYERPGKCPNWLNSFAKNYNKTIVDETRERNSRHHSLHDQINSIVNNVPLRTVDSVVKDMQERTGLAQHLHSISANESQSKQSSLQSIASMINKKGDEYKDMPQLFQDIPETKSFIDNMAKGSHGTLAIEAIVESLKDCYSKNPDFEIAKAEDNAVRRYINEQLVSHRHDMKDDNDANIGMPETLPDDTNDPDNTDMFANIGKI